MTVKGEKTPTRLKLTTCLHCDEVNRLITCPKCKRQICHNCRLFHAKKCEIPIRNIPRGRYTNRQQVGRELRTHLRKMRGMTDAKEITEMVMRGMMIMAPVVVQNLWDRVVMGERVASLEVIKFLTNVKREKMPLIPGDLRDADISEISRIKASLEPGDVRHLDESSGEGEG